VNLEIANKAPRKLPGGADIGRTSGRGAPPGQTGVTDVRGVLAMNKQGRGKNSRVEQSDRGGLPVRKGPRHCQSIVWEREDSVFYQSVAPYQTKKNGVGPLEKSI